MYENLEGVDFDRSLYVACSLRGSTEEYRQEVEDIKGILQHALEIKILRFLGLGDHSPLEVYDWDMGQVNGCSAFLGIYGHVSEGRGMETQRAFDRNIPMLGVALEGEEVNKMIIGGYERHGQPFVRVKSLRREVPGLVIRQFVETYSVL